MRVLQTKMYIKTPVKQQKNCNKTDGKKKKKKQKTQLRINDFRFSTKKNLVFRKDAKSSSVVVKIRK